MQPTPPHHTVWRLVHKLQVMRLSPSVAELCNVAACQATMLKSSVCQKFVVSVGFCSIRMQSCCSDDPQSSLPLSIAGTQHMCLAMACDVTEGVHVIQARYV